MPEPIGIDRTGGLAGGTPSPAVRQNPPPGGAAFGDLLARKLESSPLTFSGHALQRIERRGINLDPTTMKRLQDGVDRAAAKGCRNSLVLVDKSAFVVSVPNRTVITAVDQEHMREQVFTNVDSAVIA